jgi:hypothetical protein
VFSNNEVSFCKPKFQTSPTTRMNKIRSGASKRPDNINLTWNIMISIRQRPKRRARLVVRELVTYHT